MVELNENGRKVQAALAKAGFTLRDARLSIGDMIGLGLIDATPPLTGDELNAVIAGRVPPCKPS